MLVRYTLSCFAILFAFCAQAQTDIAASDVTPLDYLVPGSHDFRLTIESKGTSGVSTYLVGWRVNNGTVNTVNKTAFDTKWSGGFGLVSDPRFNVNLLQAGTYQLKVWVKSTGLTDNNPANDTITKTIKVFDALPKKKVVLEVYKHQSCGPCYPAANYTDTAIAKKNPDYSVVQIYTPPDDDLYNADGAVLNDVFNFGHPMPVFDRFKFPFEAELGTTYVTNQNGYGLVGYGERDLYFEPVEVKFESVTYNSNTRELKVKTNARFYDNLNGDYRFNLYITEDSIKSYQANAPDPQNYYHKHVLRAMVGGPWGKAGSLPASIKDKSVSSYEFTYVIPAGYNVNHLDLTVLVQTYNTSPLNRRILNSDHLTFKQALALSVASAPAEPPFRIYPNPASDYVMIVAGTQPDRHYHVRISDMAGKVYQSRDCAGDTRLNISQLPAGTYLIHTDDGNMVHTQTITRQ